MSDDVKHTFPDPPWAWRDFGSGPILVTEHSGAQVVLAAMPNNDQIVTRHPETGALVALEVDTDLARLIAAAPDLLEGLNKAYDELYKIDHLTEAEVPQPLMQNLQDILAKAEGRNE